MRTRDQRTGEARSRKVRAATMTIPVHEPSQSIGIAYAAVTAQRITCAVSVVLAFALVSILGYRSFHAALSATTTNLGNTWSALASA